MILALLSLWQQPIEISRSTDRQQLGIMLPIGVMIKDPSGGGSGGDADTLNGEDGAYYLDRANHTGTQAISTIDGLQTALDSKIEGVAWGDITGTLSDQTDLQDALDLKLDAADYNDRFLGLYASLFDLQAAHPTASAGDYAQVDLGIGTDVIVYAWDVNDAKWAAVGSSAIANTDALPEGSTNLYHTSQRVRDTPLTGFTASNTPITATDSLLQAAGKAQGQINALAAATPTYLFSQSNKTIRSVGTALNSTLSAFGSNLSFASGFLQLNDILEFEFWIKTAGAATGTVQMRLSVNGEPQDTFWSLNLSSDTVVRLSKVRLSFIVDYLPNNTTSIIPIFYANDNGTTRGTITPIARIISSSDPTQALTLNFNGFVGVALSAGSEFLFLESNVTIKRNA